MRLIIETRWRRWVLGLTREEHDCPTPTEPEGHFPLDASTERAHPDDVSERSELDGRRRVGFR